jgi:hypothetical protein
MAAANPYIFSEIGKFDRRFGIVRSQNTKSRLSDNPANILSSVISPYLWGVGGVDIWIYQFLTTEFR